jgi:hypothetical protein
MMRFVARVLVPARLRRAFRSRLDARYITKADHRQDVRSLREEYRRLHQEANDDRKREAEHALREIELLRHEVAALRDEVVRLRDATKESLQKVKSVSDGAAQARRLATEGAGAIDHVLQSEVRIWQAIDTLASRMPDAEPVR